MKKKKIYIYIPYIYFFFSIHSHAPETGSVATLSGTHLQTKLNYTHLLNRGSAIALAVLIGENGVYEPAVK